MNTKKQTAIANAYNKLGIDINNANEDGWLRIKPSQYSSHYEELDIIKFDPITHSIRPKSLQGIENNNGWISIESEDDLPKEDCDCFVRLTDGTIYADRYLSFHCNFRTTHVLNITHYQPIIEPSKYLY